MMPILDCLFGKKIRAETEQHLRELADAPARASRQSIAQSLARLSAETGEKVVLVLLR